MKLLTIFYYDKKYPATYYIKNLNIINYEHKNIA